MVLSPNTTDPSTAIEIIGAIAIIDTHQAISVIAIVDTIADIGAIKPLRASGRPASWRSRASG